MSLLSASGPDCALGTRLLRKVPAHGQSSSEGHLAIQGAIAQHGEWPRQIAIASKGMGSELLNEAGRVVKTMRLQYDFDFRPSLLMDSQRFVIHCELGIYQDSK